MDSNTLQLVGAGALIAVLGGGAYLEARRAQRVRAGDVNPMPRVRLPGISAEALKERTAFVMSQLEDLNQLPWGRSAVGDRQEAERTYQGALDALGEAEGDYRKFPPIVEVLLRCPPDLALSGAAAVIMRLAYFRNYLYAPAGVRAALAYTSAAVKSDPLSVDAWIARLLVATSVDDSRYRSIADLALKRVRELNPNHPRFPNAETMYYFRRGTKAQYEAAVHRMIDLAPSPVVKRAGYDRLAQYYAAFDRRDEAIGVYQQMFREYPEGSAWTWHNYSIQLLAAKRYQEALAASDRALAFFEFAVARDINNKARRALGMPTVEPGA
jgi:tetratricopeptide (TPR) repeat protein